MNQLHVVLIEHDEAELLYPFSLTHGTWELRAGYYTIVERWNAALPDSSVHVYSQRDGIQASYLSRNDHAQLPYQGGSTLIVLGNLLVAPDVMGSMVELCRNSTKAIHFMVGGQTAGVYLPSHMGSIDDLSITLDAIQAETVDAVHIEGHLVTRLWQVLDRISDGARWDAQLRGGIVSPASIHPSAVLDESAGPIIIGSGAVIGAFCVLQGPLVIGDNSIVKPHSHISSSVTGPHCRVSGEISGSIFQGYSNKQHAGFVGNSYIGEWVNLGAGTTTSNLKNTYSHARPRMPWGREDSQRLFLGSLIGDHTRTAIGTLLPTGGVYGVGSAIFRTSPAPSEQRSFMWDDERYDFHKALATMGVVMQRRSKTLTNQEVELLQVVFHEDAPPEA